MADNRSIVITLKLDNSSENQSDTSNQTNTTRVSNETDKNGAAKAVAAWAVTQAVQVVASEAVAWGEYYLNRELNLRDDYIGQRNKRIAATQINRGISAVSSVASGAIGGFAVGGPVGAVIGGAISLVAQIAGIERSNRQGQEQQSIMLRQMDTQLGFTRSRAGWSLQAASIGEDL